MRLLRLDTFKGGWIVGDFEPSLHKQRAVEVAVKHYKPGDVDFAHVHKVGTEITVIVYGCAMMGAIRLDAGDVIVLGPGEPMPGDWVVVEPTGTCCVKFPSSPGDKYPMETSA